MKNSQKKWNIGDVYAIKITDCKIKKYNGKYLLFNKVGNVARGRKDTNVVRVKLSDSIHEDMTKSEIDSLEYLQTSFFMFEGWKHHISNEEFPLLKKYTNEFNMIILYVLELVFPKKNLDKYLKDFIYIGNFELEPPKNELIPINCKNIYYLYLGSNDISNSLINLYEWLNLKKSPAFSIEYSDYLNNVERDVRIITELNHIIYSEKDNNKANIEEIEEPDSLTYVG